MRQKKSRRQLRIILQNNQVFRITYSGTGICRFLFYLQGKGRIFRMKTKKKDSRFGNYVFLIPAAVIYLSVIVVPVFYSLYIS